MKQSIKILLLLILILILVMAIFYKIDNVPKIKKSRSYDYTQKDAGGLLAMRRMLETGYGKSNVRIEESDRFDYLAESDEDLLIITNRYLKLDSLDFRNVRDYLERGNSVFLLGSNFNLDSLLMRYEGSTCTMADTAITLSWESDSLAYDITSIQEYAYVEQSSASYFCNPTKVWAKSDDEYSYYDRSEATGLAYIQDTMDVFRKYDVYGGTVYLHCMPSLFANDANLKEGYLRNFNRTFAEVPASSMILHKWARRNINAGTNEDSLLKYILSQPPLKYAYYLTLLGCLIYVFFSSKRKQKAIPVKEYVKNTSLDYVHTISDVFMAQQQNEKLVPHMKKVFYNKMQRKYFISKDLPDYRNKLSRKSKVPLVVVESLLNKFEQADNYAFDDDQLIRLYHDINSFYKSCK